MAFIYRCAVGLALVPLLVAGCGSGEIPGPPISVEDDLRPGMKPEDVFKLLGKPDKDVIEPSYDPKVIREVSYERYGLCLRFHTKKGLGYVEVHKRWDRPVLGVRYGDLVRKSEIVKDERFDNLKSRTWPSATFLDFYADPPPGEKEEYRIVKSILLKDPEIYGDWLPTIQLKKR